MSAKEMFKKLEYEKPSWVKDHTIEWIKYGEDEFYGRIIENSITFGKRTKKIKILGNITVKELKAINKQCEELGWLDKENK